MVYGYIRVRMRDQNEDRQLIALREMTVPEKNIYMDKQSGKDFERPAYKRMLRKMKKDDLRYIKSIDRLAETKRKYKISGEYLQKTREWTLWCRICPCWTRAAGMWAPF